MARETLSELEYFVLLAVRSIGDENCYGVTIYNALRKAERPTSLGAIYATLDRLERRDYVASWFGEPLPERGGRAKKFFRINGLGREALIQTDRTRDILHSLVPVVSKNANGRRRGRR